MWVEDNIVWLCLVATRRPALALLPELYLLIAQHEGALRSAKRREQYEFRWGEMKRRRCFVGIVLHTMKQLGPVDIDEFFDAWSFISREGGSDTWVNGPGFVRMEWYPQEEDDGDAPLTLQPLIDNKVMPLFDTDRRRQYEKTCHVAFLNENGFLTVRVNRYFSVACEQEFPQGQREIVVLSGGPRSNGPRSNVVSCL